MNVFFTCSLSKRPEFVEEYKVIMSSIKKLGHNLLTAYDILNQKLENVINQNREDRQKYYRHWLQVVNKSDIGVIEVSYPSTANIGIEVAAFIERAKPVICLYKKGLRGTFSGEYWSSRLIHLEYTRDNIKEMLQWGFEEAEQMIRRRFTFFISPQIDAFLDNVTKKTGKSRSEYIRELIEREIKPQE